MKTTLTAKYQFLDNNGGINDREFDIARINYGVDDKNNFSDFCNNIINCITDYVSQKENFNKSNILGATIHITGYRVKFQRDDGTVVDEVDIDNETVDEVKRLLVAFLTD